MPQTTRLAAGLYLVADRYELVRTREGALHSQATAWYWRDRLNPSDRSGLLDTLRDARLALAAHLDACNPDR